MTVLATYAFTGVDTTTPPSAAWTNRINGWQIATNKGKPNTNSAFNWSEYNAASPGADQYAKITISGHTSGNAQGLLLRSTAAGGFVCYLAFAGNGTVVGTIDSAGSNSALTSESSTVWADGDILEYRAVGTSLTVFRNSSQISSLNTTSSAFATGKAGIWTFTTDQLDRVDDFEVGDFATSNYVNLERAQRGVNRGINMGRA